MGTWRATKVSWGTRRCSMVHPTCCLASSSTGLAMCDPIRGADFQTRHLLLAFGAIPGLRIITGLVVAVWTLITGVIAIRQALDFGTGKAILTALFVVLPVAATGLIVSSIVLMCGPILDKLIPKLPKPLANWLNS